MPMKRRLLGGSAVTPYIRGADATERRVRQNSRRCEGPPRRIASANADLDGTVGLHRSPGPTNGATHGATSVVHSCDVRRLTIFHLLFGTHDAIRNELNITVGHQSRWHNPQDVLQKRGPSKPPDLDCAIYSDGPLYSLQIAVIFVHAWVTELFGSSLRPIRNRFFGGRSQDCYVQLWNVIDI